VRAAVRLQDGAMKIFCPLPARRRVTIQEVEEGRKSPFEELFFPKPGLMGLATRSGWRPKHF